MILVLEGPVERGLDRRHVERADRRAGYRVAVGEKSCKKMNDVISIARFAEAFLYRVRVLRNDSVWFTMFLRFGVFSQIIVAIFIIGKVFFACPAAIFLRIIYRNDRNSEWKKIPLEKCLSLLEIITSITAECSQLSKNYTHSAT